MAAPRHTPPDPEVQRETLRLWVARGKAIGGLFGFLVATTAARRAGLDWVDAGLRGLIGAAALALVGWLCALLVMSALMRTVVIHARDQEQRRIEEIAAARAKADAGDTATDASGLTDRPSPVSGTDAIASGYLVVRAEEGAYLGGLMVTDRDGLPLDFRYTDPVTPTRLQRALYGRVLDRCLRGRLLLGTLLGSLEARPSLLIVDDRDLVGEDPGLPVAFAEATGLDPLGEVGARQDEGESGTLFQTGAARSPLRVLSAAGEVDQALAATLVALSERIDVLEPAERVRTALDVIASGGVEE